MTSKVHITSSGVHEGELPSMMVNNLHRHEYVIPVAWEYKWAEVSSRLSGEAPKTRVVTVLRCSCGEEIDR